MDYKLIHGEVLVTGMDSNLIDPALADAIMKGVDALDDFLREAEAIAEIKIKMRIPKKRMRNCRPPKMK
ncbi:hypothetical protein [Persicobacter diffluens]|uniref:hypothetical protein n=1 Tax=Persicobacter diffluens TaxID=981 RepID=UPI0030C77F6E